MRYCRETIERMSDGDVLDMNEEETMLQLSAGLWLYGIHVTSGERMTLNLLSIVTDLDGGHERIYTVDEFLAREEE